MDSKARLYFDESGFTGNNLLNPDQTLFCYASVKTTPAQAENSVTRLIERYGIKNNELKGSRIIRSHKLERIVDDILEEYRDDFKITLFNKHFAICCKFFEYVFEPCISSINSVFYGIKFHRFIANILYVHLMLDDGNVKDFMAEFEYLMRHGEYRSDGSVARADSDEEPGSVMELIYSFARHNSADIRAELEGYLDTGSGKWVLDLTNTALFSSLAKWGMEYPQLEVYCDQSKPLSADQTIFDAMINRSGETVFDPFCHEMPMSFNLSGPLVLCDSASEYGIQLADVISAAFAWSCNDNNRSQEKAMRWNAYLNEATIAVVNVPELEYVDLDKNEVKANYVILMELVSRSAKGESLTDGMIDFINRVRACIPYSGI